MSRGFAVGKGMFLWSFYPWKLLSDCMLWDSLRQTALQGGPSGWGYVQVATPMQLKPWPLVKSLISLNSINS